MTRAITKPAAFKTETRNAVSAARQTTTSQSKTSQSPITKFDVTSQLIEQLKELRLPTIREQIQDSAARATSENLSHLAYLSELTTLECESRREGRIKRLLTQSQLPYAKTWDSFDFNRLPLHVARQLESLRDGSFLDRRENILIFGKPGSGKSHALCALSQQLVLQGRSLLFTTCSLLVQQLLIAKRDLRLPKVIKHLSSFEGLIIDDLGYVQQSRERCSSLFGVSSVHTSGGTLRTRQRAADEQPRLQQMGPDLQGPADDSRSDRSPRASQRDHRTECRQLPCGNGKEVQNNSAQAGVVTKTVREF